MNELLPPSRSQRTIESLLLEFRANLAQSAISGSTLTGHVWLHTGEHVEAAIKWLTEMLNAREALPSETRAPSRCRRAMDLMRTMVGAWDEEQSKRTQSIADEPWHIQQARQIVAHRQGEAK